MLKNNYKILLGMIAVGVLYAAWEISRPVEIMDIYIDNFSEGYYSNHIMVKNFPITDKGKLAWWKDNKTMLKEKYGIPKPYQDGRFSISIWDFSNGYKKMPTGDLRLSTDSSDLLCFDEMKTEKNCIDKNWIMDIEKIRDNRIFFSMGNSSYQQPVEGGEITKNAED
ncbi:hypothetical protein BZ17_2763 [Yersinia pseudotuberculosis IP 32953]|uniref:DUF943 family protein n=3 Tax=Yersinia pseudotuberculosis TaxID=633 RepID=A0ABN5R3K3_YERPU|nr:DUF943 family protein [Yersinia pseudotuberculosis]AJJ54229.1 hypothetical protein BZ17_2763 [Yersinia pseudotuberculosis IP 32953]AYW91371.1 DUF943 family protein [Yersinia pseudotuberculosis]AYW95449.1 DUF943 family protein [Yersinia pseudotuberculosis]KGA65903.1 hypothetical protein DJ55_3573 [Yersinia pseudotuberculosis]MBO1629778.1 DUF943 family protein [Yersinia pseudotuberculosis]